MPHTDQSPQTKTTKVAIILAWLRKKADLAKATAVK